MCPSSSDPVEALTVQGQSQQLFTQFFTGNVSTQFANQNLVACPIGVFFMLATLLGSRAARGETGAQLTKVLHLHSPHRPSQLQRVAEEARMSYETIFNDLTRATTVIDQRRHNVISLALGLFIKNGLEMQPAFENAITTDFKAEVKELNFTERHQAIQHINGWANEKTNGLIPRFFTAIEQIPQNIRMIILNVFYFKGPWAQPFKQYQTQQEEFFENGNRRIQVYMMNSVEKVKHATFSSEGFSMISKDLHSDVPRFSFVVVLPQEKNNLESLDALLKGEYLLSELVDEMEEKQVSIKLPRFRIEKQLQLKETIRDMGATDLFSPSRADLSGITTSQRLNMDAVMQTNVLSVDEKGIEAASVTGGLIAATSLPAPAEVEFHVKHPFACFIYDKSLKMPLLVARINNPN